jgi:hypothetical protein
MGDEFKGLPGRPGPRRHRDRHSVRHRAPPRATWWIWGAAATLVLTTISVAIARSTSPIFNKVQRLNDPKITGPILRMAHANGISTNDVYEIDASRQTTRMSANVSGFGNTMRITLNDNLLRRGSPEEIQAVMGHEMGHYVLNHIPKDILFLAIVMMCSRSPTCAGAGLGAGALGRPLADSRSAIRPSCRWSCCWPASCSSCSRRS